VLSLEACEREIVGLHAFFQAWLEGSAPATDAAFARFLQATSTAFTLISPDGTTAGAATTAAWIRASHGTRPGFRLWTDEHRLRAGGDDWALVTYREWQTNQDVTTLRLSTALLLTDANAPLGLCWAHVHETWINPPAI
jgi:hypothetical protein